MGKFEIIKRKDGNFQFNLKASNGQVVLTSEGYTTKENCKNGIESVKTNSIIDTRYDKLLSKDSKAYFTLKAANGQIIASSEMYESTSGRDNGIDSVKKNAPNASIDDLTISK